MLLKIFLDLFSDKKEDNADVDFVSALFSNLSSGLSSKYPIISRYAIFESNFAGLASLSQAGITQHLKLAGKL